MGLESKQVDKLHVFFFPLLARGHMIPMLGLAKLLAERGLRATIVTTPGNASVFRSAIDDAVNSGHSMQLLFLPFPDVGLPPGCESTFDAPRETDKTKIIRAMQLLHQPLQKLLLDHRPDCIVGDFIVMDTARLAHSLGFRYVEFRPVSAFTSVVIDKLILMFTSGCSGTDTDNDKVSLDSLPHHVELRRTELPQFLNLPPDVLAGLTSIPETNFGSLFNTFDGLDHEYIELWKDTGKRRAWCVGPVHGTKNDDGNWEGIKKWLDSREVESSVLYVSFGSECCFGHDQLREISSGLESSLRPFIWVVRGGDGGADTMEEWLPEGFREKVEGRGLILTEWVPQTSILNHPAIGGAMVHCGWNSSMEATSVGLPMILWPLHSEQFVNERFFVEVVKTAVRVLDGEMRIIDPEKKKLVGRERVEEAILKLFGDGEEVKEMRRKAEEYGKLARSAREEGGSSFADINCFIQELADHCACSGKKKD